MRSHPEASARWKLVGRYEEVAALAEANKLVVIPAFQTFEGALAGWVAAAGKQASAAPLATPRPCFAQRRLPPLA